MLDRKFIVENAELLKQNCVNRGMRVDIDRFVQLDAERKAAQTEIEELRRKANEVSKSIGKAKDETEREARKEQGRQLRERSGQMEAKLDAVSAELDVLHRAIPNLAHVDAPVGVDDKANLELFKGKTPRP